MAFSSKDLALLLPDEVDTFSQRHTKDGEAADTFEAPKPKVDHSKKITRYFPGKAPEWVDTEEPTAMDRLRQGGSGASDASKPQTVDRRLARLAKSTAAAPLSGRRRYEAMVIEDASEDPTKGSTAPTHDMGEIELGEPTEQPLDGEDDVAARRRRIKERLVAAAAAEAKQEEAAPAQESESEYETDSSEESSEEEGPVLMRPVFVPKFRRQTIADMEAKEEEASLKEAQAKLALEQKKRATHVLVAESVRRQEEMDSLSMQATTDVDSDAGLPDDSDEVDDEEEYHAWRLREMARIKRDAEARVEEVMEKAEVERRRKMTADERYAEDLKNGRFDKKEKAKWGYLQKYYHKGVFYMDDSAVKEGDVRKKDYYEPTLEDKFNKEALPAVMQVKNFGKRGRTKYTHLLDQDTTRSDAPTLHKDKQFMSQNSAVMQSYMDKRGGVGDIEKPFVKKPRNE
ncbi:unnamed protein product [Ectocarpus fasciculatus]